MFTLEEGAGEPLLLVHGWGSDGHEWNPHVAALAERYRVIVPDLPGHGRSPALDRTTPRTIAAELARSLDEPVFAVGHSMGALVVTILAVEHPELVRAVVGLDPGYGVHPEWTQYLTPVLSGPDPVAAALEMVEWCFRPATPASVRTAHRRRVAGTPAHVLVQALAGIYTDADAIGLRPASEKYLARRRCPALSIWSEGDRARWEEPYATSVRWRGVGHYLHEERPEEFVDALVGWLTREAVPDGTA